MIDPSNITNYNLSDSELEKHLLFWVLAAGKNGHTASKNLERLLGAVFYSDGSPFNAIKDVISYYGLDFFKTLMKEAGIGCYNSKARTIYELVNSKLDLSICSADELDYIYGIGMKTARCFIIHSRENAQYAGLDTHMLKHLREVGVEDVPRSTPNSRKEYLRLEKIVLKLAEESGTSPARYDLKVWNSYAVKSSRHSDIR